LSRQNKKQGLPAQGAKKRALGADLGNGGVF